MSEKKTYFIAGTCKWAKVLGRPPMDELAGIRKWSIDVYPEDAGAVAKHFKADKVNKQLKDKGEDGRCVTFTRNELTKDGNANKPIKVVGPDNEAWDEDKLIGNGSKVIVRYRLNPNPKYGNIVWVEAIKIVEHVPYEGGDLFPDDDEDEAPKGKNRARKPADDDDDDFDDDVPF